MKRILIIIGVVVFVLAVGFVGLGFYLNRGTPPDGEQPTEAPDGNLPIADNNTSPTPTTQPELSVVCPESWAGLPDGDNDELPDRIELIYHTDDKIVDTDGDGFTDGKEVRAGYHPLQKEGNPKLDSDHDGLIESEECRWRTDPFIADTDGDGFQDGAEVKNGFDPTVKGDGQGSDALPERRALLAQQALNQLRPDPNSPNYTEGLAALLTKGTPVNQLSNTQVTPDQVANILNQAKVDTTLPTVSLTDLIVGKSNTPADILAYLRAIDEVRPQDFNDPAKVTNALTAAVSGNVSGIAALRSRLSAYEAALRAITVPPSAVEHHKLLIALTRFVNNKFGEVQQYAVSDPVRAYLALRALQEGLPQYVNLLETRRAELNKLAQGA